MKDIKTRNLVKLQPRVQLGLLHSAAGNMLAATDQLEYSKLNQLKIYNNQFDGSLKGAVIFYNQKDMVFFF